MKIIDFRWPWNQLRAIAAKRCEIVPKLLSKGLRRVTLLSGWNASPLRYTTNHQISLLFIIIINPYVVGLSQLVPGY